MTIDERLEKLTERHEALAQHLELMQRHWEERHQRLERVVANLAKYSDEIGEGTARLLHIAQIHEQRIEKLEGKGGR